MKVVFPYDGYENLGIGYLTSVLKEAGHDVSIVQVDFGNYISGYNRRWQETVNRVAGSIIKRNPDVIALSMVNTNALAYSALAGQCKKLSNVKSMAGGAYPTAEPELTLNSGNFDAVVIGEAEDVIVDLLRILKDITL